MADFILNRNRKITVVDPYPFPEGVFQIYGNGRFYNGFSIGDTSNLSVVNRDGVLKFSRGAANAQEMTSVILGTMPKNKKNSIWIDIATPLSQRMTSLFAIDGSSMLNYEEWTSAQITHTKIDSSVQKLQRGGVLSIYFKSTTALPAIPDLLAVRAIWVK